MITNYSKEFLSQLVKDKVAKPNILTHYDIIKDWGRGLSIGQLAIKYNVCKQTIHNVLKK